MIWLRHEVWEHHDGLSYRLADKAETDRLASVHPEGVIQHVFYAPTPAAAVAQYYALRHLGPYVPGSDVSQSGFTAEQLASQQAGFPDDEVLAGQGVAHLEARAAHEPETHDPVQASHDAHDAHGEGAHAEEHPVADDHAGSDIHHAAPTEHKAVDHAPPAAHHAEPATTTEPALHAPVSTPPPHDPKDLWPVAEEEVVAPRWASRPRRKSNPFLAFLRTLLLLIILAGIALGLCIVTGTVDGPALLTQVRDLSIVKSVLPSA